MSDDLTLLTQIAGDVGYIRGRLDSLHSNFDAHVISDKLVEDRVVKLEAQRIKQSGKIASVWGTIGTAVGSGAVGLISLLWKHHK
jgi:hypothetical protein